VIKGKLKQNFDGAAWKSEAETPVDEISGQTFF